MRSISIAVASVVVALAPSPAYAEDAQGPDAAPPPILETPTMESQPAQSVPLPAEPPPPAPPPPAGVSAPPPRLVHDGFYLAVSQGIAQVSISGEGPNGSASLSGLGSTTGLAIGGSPVRGLAIAGVLRAATKTGTFNGGPTVTATTTRVVNGVSVTSPSTLSGRAQASIFMIGVQADWFPRPEDGWHVGAGIGLGGESITDDAGGTNSAASVSGSLFGGYEWWIGLALVDGTPGCGSRGASIEVVGFGRQ